MSSICDNNCAWVILCFGDKWLDNALVACEVESLCCHFASTYQVTSIILFAHACLLSTSSRIFSILEPGLIFIFRADRRTGDMKNAVPWYKFNSRHHVMGTVLKVKYFPVFSPGHAQSYQAFLFPFARAHFSHHDGRSRRWRGDFSSSIMLRVWSYGLDK